MSGSARKMRAGRVVQVRLNPKDCMAAIDITQQAGMYQPGMSFSQVVIIAFACMSESFRKSEIIPDRDGFEYSDMMAPFPDTTRGRGALQYKLGKELTLRSPENPFPAVELKEPSQEEIRSKFIDPLKHPDPNVRRMARRIGELDDKREADPNSFDQQDQEEYDRLQKEILPYV